MQDRYAFDLGDFSKLGLIRRLHAGDPGRRVGLLWYANVPVGREQTNADGKHIGYLCPDDAEPTAVAVRRFRSCDPALYDAMRSALRDERRSRSIAGLERLSVWPPGMAWHRDWIPARGEAERAAWFAAARAAVAGCSLVVCDPDNGICWDAPGRTSAPSPKHMLSGEIAELLGAGASLVLYHHCDRSAAHAEQARRHVAEVKRRHPGLGNVVPLRFRRGSSRLYLVLAQPDHVAWIDRALIDLGASPWFGLGHFEQIE